MSCRVIDVDARRQQAIARMLNTRTMTASARNRPADALALLDRRTTPIAVDLAADQQHAPQDQELPRPPRLLLQREPGRRSASWMAMPTAIGIEIHRGTNRPLGYVANRT